MTDKELLSQKIRDSGLKKEYLAEKCGLTRQGLYNKIEGICDFTAPEIDKLCKELGITDLDEKERIFFASEVE